MSHAPGEWPVMISSRAAGIHGNVRLHHDEVGPGKVAELRRQQDSVAPQLRAYVHAAYRTGRHAGFARPGQRRAYPGDRHHDFVRNVERQVHDYRGATRARKPKLLSMTEYRRPRRPGAAALFVR